MLVAVNTKVIKIKDNNNNERIIHKFDHYDLVRQENDDLIICSGENSGKKFESSYAKYNIKPITFNEDKIFQITKENNIEDALKIFKEVFNNTYFEVKENNIININDEKLIKAAKESIDITEKDETKEEKKIEQEEYLKKINNTLPRISDAYAKILETVVCQDEQVKTVLTAIYNNIILSMKDTNSTTKARLKRNVLMYGPTGVGKTEIVRQISQILKVPMHIEDCKRFTTAGYHGADVDEMITNLIKEAKNHNMTQSDAERGIIVLDEFDKLREHESNSNDVGGKAVQEALLKYLEGTEVTINDKNNSNKVVTFNTSNVSFICLGAFAGIEKIIGKRTSLKRDIGFNAIIENKPINDNTNKTDATTDDFIEYGITGETMGRLSSIVRLNALDKNALKEILSLSKNSLIKCEQEFYEDFDKQLVCTNELIDELCNRAISLGCGARSLNRLLSNLFTECQYEIFDKIFDNNDNNNNFNEIILTKETLDNPKKFILK